MTMSRREQLVLGYFNHQVRISGVRNLMVKITSTQNIYGESYTHKRSQKKSTQVLNSVLFYMPLGVES